MAARHRVLRSVETGCGSRCVDIFVRTDGTFGFEEYRRDAEDGRGWFPIGFHAGRSHATEPDAWQAAVVAVPWLSNAGRPGGVRGGGIF